MRLIFYIIVAYVVYRVAKSLFSPIKVRVRTSTTTSGGGEREEGGAGEPEAAETVLDPVCGSYLAKDLAVTVNKDGKVVYFCGDECRDKFTSEGVDM